MDKEKNESLGSNSDQILFEEKKEQKEEKHHGQLSFNLLSPVLETNNNNKNQ